jgi:hypothetical protein
MPLSAIRVVILLASANFADSACAGGDKTCSRRRVHTWGLPLKHHDQDFAKMIHITVFPSFLGWRRSEQLIQSD